MDNSDVQRAPSVAYGPDRRLAIALAAGAVVFVVLAVTSADAPARLIYGTAVVVLGVVSAGDLLVNPRLVLDGAGILVRTARSTTRLRWAEVDGIQVDSRGRFGVAARTLEIDAAGDLLVFSGRSLGTDPQSVAAVMAAFRSAGPRGPGPPHT